MNNILEQLYVKEKQIKEEILKHDFFDMNREEAIKFFVTRLETSILISEGKLFSTSPKTDFYGDINNLVNIIQSTSHFIFYHLKEETQKDSSKIEVLELRSLLQKIYDYLEFKKYIQLFKNKIVNVVFSNNILRFEYKRESYKINDIYNGYWHMMEQQNAMANIEKIQDITDKMFDLTEDINFGDFTLEDYKLFCKGMDELIKTEYKKPVMIVNEIGYIELGREMWVEKLVYYIPELCSEKITQIIKYLTYDFEKEQADPILSYFIPLEGKLLLSFTIFLSQRLDKNILRLFNIKDSSRYQNEQKKLESHQINHLSSYMSDAYDFDMDKDGSPGEDLIVYDKKANIVHVIELKYKLPVDTVNEIRNLKQLLSKAKNQNTIASKTLTFDNIFEKYFDKRYKEVKPSKILYFSLTNYSVDYFSDQYVMLEQHYIQLLKADGCSKRLENIFCDKYRGLNLTPKLKFKKINLFGNVIKIPVCYSEIPSGSVLKV